MIVEKNFFKLRLPFYPEQFLYFLFLLTMIFFFGFP